MINFDTRTILFTFISGPICKRVFLASSCRFHLRSSVRNGRSYFHTRLDFGWICFLNLWFNGNWFVSGEWCKRWKFSSQNVCWKLRFGVLGDYFEPKNVIDRRQLIRLLLEHRLNNPLEILRV